MTDDRVSVIYLAAGVLALLIAMLIDWIKSRRHR